MVLRNRRAGRARNAHAVCWSYTQVCLLASNRARFARRAGTWGPEACAMMEESGLLKAGECAHCGTLNRLNEAGLCPACRELPACAIHPERLSASRCRRCRAPHCAECLQTGLCAECRLAQEAP